MFGLIYFYIYYSYIYIYIYIYRKKYIFKKEREPMRKPVKL